MAAFAWMSFDGQAAHGWPALVSAGMPLSEHMSPQMRCCLLGWINSLQARCMRQSTGGRQEAAAATAAAPRRSHGRRRSR